MLLVLLLLLLLWELIVLSIISLIDSLIRSTRATLLSIHNSIYICRNFVCSLLRLSVSNLLILNSILLLSFSRVRIWHLFDILLRICHCKLLRVISNYLGILNFLAISNLRNWLWWWRRSWDCFTLLRS